MRITKTQFDKNNKDEAEKEEVSIDRINEFSEMRF